MASDNKLNTDLWSPRSVEETQKIYADWAGNYDADVTGAGYQTPARLAAALAAATPDRDAPILDYGCGTGLSGAALAAEGFRTLDGTDINAEMLAEAAAKGLYRRTWQSAPGRPAVTVGDYAAITATGVISLGAAPPETLAALLECLAPGGLLAFSFNDATLADPSYIAALDTARSELAEQVSEAFGPHLESKDMSSTVFVLRRM
ncbi:MAG: methyltransferase domain-containing protein [Pseudomonadota bacterium]